jgi:hypothetical protein
MMCRRSSLFVLSVLIIQSFSGRAQADDYFLTIGGGYSPTGNQISLERNVLLFQQFVQEQYPSGARHDVFFSDGEDASRDIQFEDPELEIPRANLLLAQVFRQTKYLRNRYRTHEVPNIRGATSRDNLAKWFDEVGANLKAGDRLFVYVTAHGGRSVDKKTPHNTKLYLWNTQSMQMKDWVAQLDKVPEKVAVMTVMVQCYCGGFANLLFNEGDSKKGIASANRCGFFATTHTRPAAGCTPDINEENYHEYSTYFWQAIRGQTRTGSPIERPDYDGDGEISFAEAHAYALLTSTSVDISVKTSDAFLRAYSKMKIDKPKTVEVKKEDSAESPSVPAVKLLTADTPFEELFQLASPADQAVLEGLSLDLGLVQPERDKAAKARAAELMKEKQQLDTQYKKKSGEFNTAASNIRKTLTNRWPEMNNRWHPTTVEVLANESEELVKLIESHPDFSKFDKLRDETKKLSEQKLDVDRQWVKCQRLIRTLENVALAANLPHVAPTDSQERYRMLVAAESGTFGPQKPSAASKTAASK